VKLVQLDSLNYMKIIGLKQSLNQKKLSNIKKWVSHTMKNEKSNVNCFSVT